MVASLRSSFFSVIYVKRLLRTYMDYLHGNAVGNIWEGFPGIRPRAKRARGAGTGGTVPCRAEPRNTVRPALS